MQPFNWEKKGLVFKPNIPGFSHGSHPCIMHIKDDKFLVSFTCRDDKNRSHIFLSNAILINYDLKLMGSPKLALEPGPLGYFDSDGVISVCFITHNHTHYLYYVGWQNLPEGLWICDTGRTIVDPERLSLKREFPGPVLARDKDNPLFAAGTAFKIIDGKWHTWYNSGIKWEKSKSNIKHYYGIHHAISDNGIDWNCEREMCIPFSNEYEYAFGRPCVVLINNVYCMWFAHRASKHIKNYRMGFAYSEDASNWIRRDKWAGIDVSNKGWDDEMICYPYVFKHKANIYMLYNGNDYGRTGFGLAILKD